jgi:hypothetical protein
MKVCTLINNGDLSSLRENVEPTGAHSFDKPQDNVCVYYGRDRGETDVNYRMFTEQKEFLRSAEGACAEYAYLFQNGQWIVFSID